MKNESGTEIPLGLGMILAKDLNAMNKFSALSDEEQKKIIEYTHQIQSKQEMEEYVQTLFK